ncbi:hypothetical protein BJX65DRAFT_97313 [Aspergillus insuetus]
MPSAPCPILPNMSLPRLAADGDETIHNPPPHGFPEPPRPESSSPQTDLDTNPTPSLSNVSTYPSFPSLDSSPASRIFSTPLSDSILPSRPVDHVSTPRSTHHILLPHLLTQAVPVSRLQCTFCDDTFEYSASLL